MIEVDGSLKARLGVWLLLTVSTLGALLLVEAYASARRAAERAYDSQLEAAALTIAEAIQWQEGLPVVEIPVAALQILATRHQERVFYSVLDASGGRVSANLGLAISGAWRAQVDEAPQWVTTEYRGTGWRLHGWEFASAGWETQEPVQIWVGHTLSGRQALTGELFRRAVTRFLVMVLVAGLLMLLAMRVALTPMRRLRHVLRQREADDMRPLEARVPEELRELAETLNGLFARQRDNRDALLRFTADASHQIKTPLAGLQASSEIALKSTHPQAWRQALESVHSEAQRTSRLANQLLSLSRLRHVADPDDLISLDLSALLFDVVFEWAERESAAAHDLGLADTMQTGVCIRGEPWALRELIGNLIDNALCYTPTGSVITLGVETRQGMAELFIEDNGPGVAPTLLSRLRHPFERGGRQDTQGSGLGLAIVDSIARRHQATLKIGAAEPQGLCIRIRFPLASCEADS